MNKIAFIGAGAMAEAILSGILKQELIKKQDIFVTNKSNRERLKHIKNTYKVKTSTNKKAVVQNANIILLSMKPQDLQEAAKQIRPHITDDQLIISVIAGVSTERLQQILNTKVAIVRAMPNTSAAIGKSTTALCKGKLAKEKHIQKAKQLFNTIGLTISVKEDDMHIITAISGSGPAYIYYLVEAMEEAAISAGLQQDIAQQLIHHMINGASHMLIETKKNAKQLRHNITSPKGTTEAGLNALKQHHFQDAIEACIQKATHRSKELGEEN